MGKTKGSISRIWSAVETLRLSVYGDVDGSFDGRPGLLAEVKALSARVEALEAETDTPEGMVRQRDVARDAIRDLGNEARSLYASSVGYARSPEVASLFQLIEHAERAIRVPRNESGEAVSS